MLYCLLTGELVLRAAAFVWAPVSPFVAHHRVHDERLGWRLNPAYPDVDAWSFRNTTVPAQADIVILGDSQTYGYGVAPHLAWPRQLTQLTGWTSYNIACSGYSPVHGLAIWEDVLSLRPCATSCAITLPCFTSSAISAVAQRRSPVASRTPGRPSDSGPDDIRTICPSTTVVSAHERHSPLPNACCHWTGQTPASTKVCG